MVPEQQEPAALNVGLLLFIPYRALETQVFEALAAAGLATSRRRRRGCSSAWALTAPGSPSWRPRRR